MDQIISLFVTVIANNLAEVLLRANLSIGNVLGINIDNRGGVFFIMFLFLSLFLYIYSSTLRTFIGKLRVYTLATII